VAEGGRIREAIEQLRKGLGLQPDSADGQNGLGIALAKAGSLDEAVAHLQRAVTLAPQSAGYRYNLGRVYAAKGDFREALTRFEEAAMLSRMQDPSILEMLAAMYSETGRYSDAIETAQRALDLATEQKNYTLVASLKASLGRYSGLAQGVKRD
jgi:Flp pilus assembly protein TadD